jgi:hypothetical protein
MNKKRLSSSVTLLLSCNLLFACKVTANSSDQSLETESTSTTPTQSSDTTSASTSSDALCHCNFLNYDNSVLWSTTVAKGGTIVYAGPTPSKPSENKRKKYVFSGWDHLLSNINVDINFWAVYEEKDNSFSVSFVDGNKTYYQTEVIYGDCASYQGNNPTKEDKIENGIYTTYSFTGWDPNPAVTPITKSTTFNAVYETKQYDSESMYTYREALSESPTNWNPHTRDSNSDGGIPNYCEMGFVAQTKKKDADEYEFVYEMATNISDVTKESDYQQSAFMTKWGIKAGQTGRVWKIDLNQSAKWEDGTVINADSYVESMKEDLDPAMKNSDALAYYIGDTGIAGARNYFNGTSNDWDSVGLLKTGDYSLLYITVNEVTPFCFKSNVTSNWLVYKTIYDNLKTTASVTATTYGTAVNNYRSYGPYRLVSFDKDQGFRLLKNEKWYGWTDCNHVGEYQTTAIDVSIVKDHATALSLFQSGLLDQITLENGEYPTYKNSHSLVNTPQIYLMRFSIDSNLDDLAKLETGLTGVNKRILHQYDFRKALSLMIDRSKFNMEGTTGNTPYCGLISNQYYYDIENDPSSVYRNTDEAKSAIVDMYGVEYGTGKAYATLDDAYKSINGYNLSQAKSLFESAAVAAIKDGTWNGSDAVKFDVGYRDKTDANALAQISYLNEAVSAATTGTKLENKVSFAGKSFNGTTTPYIAIAAGSVEMANCAWGGSAFWPFNQMDVYVGANGYDIQEIRSFDSRSEKLTMTYDFNGDGTAESVTDSYFNWAWNLGTHSEEDSYKDANGKEVTTSHTSDPTWDIGIDPEANKLHNRLYTLSRIEEGLLKLYNFIVVGEYSTPSLLSQKVSYGTTTYNPMYGFGGLRWLTYNYNNGKWDTYVKSQGGTLDYTK